ncbi:uncharacterized protein LOC118645713 isoform X1 [Monomorium pharaonis]|uniref:uncharacterized protein LOC118645713 isoform X1 n=1 Tax=Monomorium pharaonis TaxID=307658 RepID=UPI00174715B3|nr:uncharacterized protein LOC118645713 isoform X1 [Monomorium pharaonis]XP_036143290.1 uncharacterized protein LOC118645713 isoform X1 [Monomorium pharaonis]
MQYSKLNLKESSHYFIYIPLEAQLKNLVNSEVFYQFRKIDNEENDIVNGNVYKQLRERNVINDFDLSITWNTNGVSLHKCSKCSMWPLQVCINELPYRVRRKNMILCGLFYNETKPIMNIFLESFVKELLSLCENGFNSTTIYHEEPINIKVHTILCSVDSVARPLIQNIKQYNGAYGCLYCFHIGERINVGRGFARVYRYKKNIETRSKDMHDKLVKEAVENNIIKKGVKGPSIMSLLPYHDIIHAYPPEYMHACILGVGKLFGSEWFNSKNSNEQWYMGRKCKEFDDKMLTIKPPCEVTRTPQSILNYTNYKANDWKNFILYYSLPCLSNLMKQEYIKHWFLFIYGLSIFLKTTITEEEFQLAETALHSFVKNTEMLYGKTFMKYNVHLLLHLPLFIKNYGSLWAWSAFPFEHYNGVLKQLYHGTQFIPQQICKLYYRLKYIQNQSIIFSDARCSTKSKNLYLKLMNECRVKNCIEYEDNLRIFEKPQRLELSVVEKLVIETTLEERINSFALKYYRFIYKNILYHSYDYRRLLKRNNSCILADTNLLLIVALIKVKCSVSEDIKYVILGKKLTLLNENICSSAFSYITQESTTLVCCKISSIVRKCIVVPYVSDKLCVYPIENIVEMD